MKIGFDKSNIDDVFSPCLDKEKLKPLTDSYNFFSYWSSVFYEEDGELLTLKNYKVPKDIISFYENFEPRVVYADKSWFLFNEEERKLEFSFYPFEIEEEWDAEDYYECIGNKS